jgi:CubicO group peptidase (beta-lactamase class C family)
MAKTPPFYPVNQTPMYNNIGYVLLSYVAEAITGRPFMKMIEDTIIKPLNLSRTFIEPADDKYGIIPGDRIETLWGKDFGNESP